MWLLFCATDLNRASSYPFIYLVPTDKLPFWLILKETAIILQLLVYRLLLLRYVLVVSHKFRNDCVRTWMFRRIQSL